MNILYWLRQYPKLSESFVLNEIYELDRRGHDVAIFALDDPGETLKHSEVSDLDISVKYATLPPQIDLQAVLNTRVFNRHMIREAAHLTKPLYQLGCVYLANQCLDFIDAEGFDPDIIHSHFATVDKLGAQYAAAHEQCAHTITAHAFEIFANPDWPLLNVLFKKCDRIIVPSEYNKEYLQRHGKQTSPIDVVPATTRVDKFDPSDSENPYRLLTVGRLVEKKGIRYAIKAVAELRDEFPDIEYHIIGNGELKTDLQRMVSNKDVDDHVVFFENVSDEKLIDELNEAAVFILPSVIASDGDRDAMPVVLKEAMAMKTACVSTDISAIPELITDGHDGLLVPSNNATELADAVRRLLSDPDLRQRIGKNGRVTVEKKFDIQRCVDSLEDAFGDV